MKAAIVKFVFLVFVAIVTTSIATPSWAEPPKVNPPAKDEFQVNPHFSPDKTPAKDQPLQMEKSQKAMQADMQELDQEVKSLCKKKNIVYRVNPTKSSLKVTAFKNYKIPVVGKLMKFDGYITWQKGKGELSSALLMDTGSWDSGVAERDSRVKHFLLHADEKKFADATLKSKYKGEINPGVKEIENTLKFRNKKYDIKSKNKVTKDGDNWIIEALEPVRLHAKIPKGDLLDIMDLCNHEALSPAVDLDWNLVYEPACIN